LKKYNKLKLIAIHNHQNHSEVNIYNFHGNYYASHLHRTFVRACSLTCPTFLSSLVLVLLYGEI